MITLINHQGLKLIKGIQIQTPSPSIGLAYIGAFLKQHAIQYTAIDACGAALDQIFPLENDSEIMVQGLTNKQILERIPKDTKIFGFTCLFSNAWPLVNHIALGVRELFPEAIFIAGGEHPTALPDQVLNSGAFDAVVMGEGEETFLEMINKIKNNEPWQDVDGICYLNNQNHIIKNVARKRVRNIDNFPYPDWDEWSIEEYISHNQVTGINLGRSIPILGSRGCPYACTFCSNEDMWTRQYIMREGKSLANEMEFMKNKYSLTGFSFMDSTFVVNRKKTLDFCNEVIKKDMNITYQIPAGTRCEAFDVELAKKLEESGLKNLALAPESGSEMIREVTKKQIKIDDFFRVVKIFQKVNITVGCFVVIGFPEDNISTLKESLAMIRKLAVLGVDDITVSKFTPYPGSPLFNQFRENGVIDDKLEELADIISFYSSESKSYSESLTSKQLHFWMIWMFLNFYVITFVCRPMKVIKNFWDYFSKGVENARYMRFFTEIFVLRRKWEKS
ncbi:MAG: radical SAM protein [Nitrospina sp.]|nr:radical SAM protein [Nitrospina sp.]